VAFYGCGCGDFGCANVAGLIIRQGDRVVWEDFRSLTGAYYMAMPNPEQGPDPLDSCDEDEALFARRHDLPALTFDADVYLETVHEAMADRSWETRPRAVIRHLLSRRPELNHWAADEEESITVHHRHGNSLRSTDIPLPPGPPEELAEKLLALLDQGIDPRAIVANQLW
jgi:hypothetical protein